MTIFMNKYFRVLDHGFVGLKDFMGTDADIEQAARVSYGKGTRKRSETRGLIRYLLSHRHTTPFEMCEIKFHIRMPMDAHRQQIRHRTMNVNEYSTRYSLAINVCQQTKPDEWRSQAKNNKQGSGDYITEWPEENNYDNLCMQLQGAPSYKDGPGKYLSWREQGLQQYARELYEERIDLGVAREQARKDLPLSTYTEYYWKGDLHNLLHYISLRCDPHAQKEIRNYANIIAGFVKELFPLTFEAWYDYRFGGSFLSRLDRRFFQYLLDRYGKYGFDNITELQDKHEKSEDKYPINILGMTKREIEAFWNKLNIPEEKDFALDIEKAEPFENFAL